MYYVDERNRGRNDCNFSVDCNNKINTAAAIKAWTHQMPGRGPTKPCSTHDLAMADLMLNGERTGLLKLLDNMRIDYAMT